jgi:hypothetical protein
MVEKKFLCDKIKEQEVLHGLFDEMAEKLKLEIRLRK